MNIDRCMAAVYHGPVRTRPRPVTLAPAERFMIHGVNVAPAASTVVGFLPLNQGVSR